MISDLLRSAGIEASVFGQELQGGVGELPAAGLIRVMVPENQAAQARQVIQEWERSSTTSSHDHDPRRPFSTLRSSLFQFGSGIFAGVALTFLLAPDLVPSRHTAPLTADQNRDGAPDVWLKRDDKGQVVRQALDRNGDGREDKVTRLDRGVPVAGREDSDFDGHFDSRWLYQWPDAEMERDLNRDGQVEYREVWRQGQLASQHWYDQAGRTIRVAHYRHGQLIESETDLDGDGRIDARTRYSWYGTPLSDQP